MRWDFRLDWKGKTEFFNTFFAEYNEVLVLIDSGARFQILAASHMNVEVRILPPESSVSLLACEDLVLLFSIASLLLCHWIGKVGEC